MASLTTQGGVLSCRCGMLPSREVDYPVIFVEAKEPGMMYFYIRGGFKYFLFSTPYLGKIPILTNIFQMG